MKKVSNESVRAFGELTTRIREMQTREMRALLTRALTAQAWAVACIVADEVDREDRQRTGDCPAKHDRAWNIQDNIADLPSPAELADEILRGAT